MGEVIDYQGRVPAGSRLGRDAADLLRDLNAPGFRVREMMIDS